MNQPTPDPAPTPEPDRDRETTLDAAATPGNTPVTDPPAGEPDPTVADRADPVLRHHPGR